MKRAEYINGWFAHKNGVDAEQNPYNEKSQYASNSLWLSGWVDRFAAIKHGRELELDGWYEDTP